MLTRADRPTGEDVLDAVRSAVGVVLEVEQDRISRDTTFAELKADSLVLVEVAEILEQRFSPLLHIPDADLEAMRTIGDAADYTLARL